MTYESIFEAIHSICDHDSRIEMRFGKDRKFCSILFYGQLGAKIVLNSKSRYLLIPSVYLDDPASFGLPYQEQKDRFTRLDILPTDDLAMFTEVFRDIHEDLEEQSIADTFGCCHNFLQCSDALACVHLDEEFYRGCMYRKHLEAGRIFYGKYKDCHA